MPNRIIREAILSSEKMALLSWAEEVFYRRLLSIVDDHGRYEANPQLLRSKCYPLHTDATVQAKDIAAWLVACQRAGVLQSYAVASKRYLQVINFGQQQRTPSKYPEPPALDSNCEQTIGNEHLGVSVFVSEGVGVVEGVVATLAPPPPAAGEPPPPSPTAAPTPAPTPTLAAKPKRVRLATDEDPPTNAIWRAYAQAYHEVYDVEPVRNLKVNGQLANLLSRLGKDDAPHVADFYVRDTQYRNKQHPIDLLLRDAEGLRTRWARSERGLIALRAPNRQEALESSNREIAHRWANKEQTHEAS